ncbi:DUF2577 domain-containing protein [Brevibacillus laterosporus]|uniref:DUF2577 domain-containing protein n=1 Tax=Brevibacillus laterosporus TaxID=1465 RepID=UPI000839B729|nr:DUF2577 domain-containing protein [Brevibacillus laterosporus]AYK07783.1 DUF2577 domain-containing protein [Brevibacillus laterosporus]
MSTKSSKRLQEPSRLEGGGPSQFRQLIQQIGYNKDVDIELGTVVAPPPAIRVTVDNDEKLELLAEDLIVAEHLTRHKRKVTLTSETVREVMTRAGYTPHVHDITELVIEGEIEFTDELKAGDRVIIQSIDEGQTYIIQDRAVIYNGA